ncbi:class III extradiol dioxygenase family protein [Siccirubricoccus phaeus]|uniref:class III extradiol dioxygenase family protein n=1 Tax=Siccirubricoccus phaeus TaxID=2595053 RepID=UPI0011F2A7DE|nr:class III extradiol dioxygenase family protein [Siccirubricoccus phaeus]
MAQIIGGIGCSHAPSIAMAWDAGKQQDPEWKPFFDGYLPVRGWLAAAKPDLVIAIYNDHLNAFRFDRYPTLALGAADLYPVADEGRGPRDLPPLPGDAAFSWQIAESLVEQGFDPTICQELPVDHGLLSCLPLLLPPPWTVPVVPIAVNVIQQPVPPARRLFALGQALRRAVAAEGSARRVLVLGTGGMSHQLHGPGFGAVAPEWDNEFLDLLEKDPAALTALPNAEYMRRGGAEAIEVILWLAMRGALTPRVLRQHRHYHAGLLTGYGLISLTDAE